MKNTEFSFEDFEIDFRNPLGEGGVGTVFKATEKNTGKVYAVKRFSIDVLNIQEIDNMLLMNKCENSIKYFGSFKDKKLIYLIMEICDYSLAQITKNKKLDVKEIKEILEK